MHLGPQSRLRLCKWKADRCADTVTLLGLSCTAGRGAAHSPHFLPAAQSGAAPQEPTAPAQAQMLAECLSHLLIGAACVLPARDIAISLHLCRADSCNRGRVASCQRAEVGILEASTRAGCSTSSSLSSRVPTSGKSPACESCVAGEGEVSSLACSACDNAEPLMLHVCRHGRHAASGAE